MLSVLMDLVRQFEQNRAGDERLRTWLDSTVNVLFAFSATLGEGVGLVIHKITISRNLRSDHCLSGILTCKGDLCRDRRPSTGGCLSRSLDAGGCDSRVC